MVLNAKRHGYCGRQTWRFVNPSPGRRAALPACLLNPRSSVGKSERVLIARSMVRVHPGKLAVCPIGRRLRPDCKSAKRGSQWGRVSKSSRLRPGRDVLHGSTGRAGALWLTSHRQRVAMSRKRGGNPATLPFEPRGASMLGTIRPSSLARDAAPHLTNPWRRSLGSMDWNQRHEAALT